jgi:hypothetical protein
MEYNQSLRNQSIQSYNYGVDHPNTMFVVKTKTEIEAQKDWYADKINAAYFTMRIFTHSTNYSSFVLIAFLVCFGLFLPHALLFFMMRSKQFVYQSSVRMYFKGLIEQNFTSLEREAKQHLSRYQGIDPETYLKVLYSNNPYLPKSEYTHPKVMSYDQYLASKKSTAPRV